MKAPELKEAAWAGEDFAKNPETLEVARRGAEEAEKRVEQAETKSTRLLQTSLSLLAISVGLLGFIGKIVLEGPLSLETTWPLLPVSLAILCLVLASIDAFEVDRVGLFSAVIPNDLSDDAEPVRAEVIAQEKRRQLASWTANHKFSVLLQARAWFSRGLLLLVVSAIIAATMHAKISSDGLSRKKAPNQMLTPSPAAIEDSRIRGASTVTTSASEPGSSISPTWQRTKG